MGENVQSAINKLTAAMSRLDENQATFEKEGDYKEMSEAFKAAYGVEERIFRRRSQTCRHIHR